VGHYRSDKIKLNGVKVLLDEVSVVWVKKVLLFRVRDKLTQALKMSREDKIEFLSDLAVSSDNIDFKDAVYQSLEEEEKNFRRII
jgi:hypothetical protein